MGVCVCVLLAIMVSMTCSELAALQHELETTNDARAREQSHARETIAALERELASCREDAASKQAALIAREQTLALECDALKQLVAHEQSYWTRFEAAKQREVESLHALVATARADAQTHKQQSDRLGRELQSLQSRVDAATRASRHLEQRLAVVSHEKRDSERASEAHVRRLQRKVADKREQNRLLADALATRDDELQRLRPRQIDAAHELQSHAPTSPTASSPDVTPPTTPHKRKPARSSSSSSRSRDQDAVPAKAAASRSRQSSRMEREMSDLRRKLDACMRADDDDDARL